MYRLDCKVKKYRKTDIPVTFIVNTEVKGYPSVAYDSESKRVLGGKKFNTMRPLKELSYCFTLIYSLDGRVLYERTHSTGENADNFVKIILEEAHPITEEEARVELGSLVWPSETREKREKRKTLKKTDLLEELLWYVKDLGVNSLRILVSLAKILLDEEAKGGSEVKMGSVKEGNLGDFPSNEGEGGSESGLSVEISSGKDDFDVKGGSEKKEGEEGEDEEESEIGEKGKGFSVGEEEIIF